MLCFPRIECCLSSLNSLPQFSQSSPKYILITVNCLHDNVLIIVVIVKFENFVNTVSVQNIMYQTIGQLHRQSRDSKPNQIVLDVLIEYNGMNGRYQSIERGGERFIPERGDIRSIVCYNVVAYSACFLSGTYFQVWLLPQTLLIGYHCLNRLLAGDSEVRNIRNCYVILLPTSISVLSL